MKSTRFKSGIAVTALAVSFLSLALLSCGEANVIDDPEPIPISGVFLDSPVYGVAFSTSSQSGQTDASGGFLYLDGETVSFSIGQIALGTVPGRPVVTPVDIVGGATDETDQRVVNICRLLQSLDLDGDPSNGIHINDAIRQAIAGIGPIDFNQTPENFGADSQVLDIFESLNDLDVFPGGTDRELIDADEAIIQLKEGVAHLDLDGDGYTGNAGDCRVWDATVHPGAEDILDDGIDQDCSGSDASACDQVTSCSPNGACVVTGSGVACECDDGYEAEGLTCIVIPPIDVCDPNPCVSPNRTVCSELNGDAICSCDPGYEDNGSGLCVDPNADPVLVNMLIYPMDPYAGYEPGTLMDWPDQGFTNQLSVIGIFSDGSTEPEFAGPVSWSSGNQSAATVTPTGLLESGDVSVDAIVTITATSGDVEATFTVNVLNTPFDLLTIISDNDYDWVHDGDYSVAVENTETWRCLAENTAQGSRQYDVTRAVYWYTDDSEVLAVGNGEVGGTITRHAAGPVLVTCGIERTYYVTTNVIVN